MLAALLLLLLLYPSPCVSIFEHLIVCAIMCTYGLLVLGNMQNTNCDCVRPCEHIEQMATVSSVGQSDKHNAARNNVRRIYALFTQAPDTGDKFKDFPNFQTLPEQLACSMELYEQFAHYMVHVYRIEQQGPTYGQPLLFSSVLDYLGILVNMAANMYKANG